ncbi:MAG: 1-hydroxycarotenoid 3,4-desaturase CrtD [Pseudomonadota bacterium]
MFDEDRSKGSAHRTLVIGAGVGGLATALRLQSAGHQVTVFDTHNWPGGKMRTVPSPAGPVDAGPTVLTMRHVFDDLFAASGARLADHATLVREPSIARHFWRDGSQLDLTDDHATNEAAIAGFAGSKAAREYRVFSDEASDLFRLFSEPMMQSASPSVVSLAKASLTHPKHLTVLTPFATLRKHLKRRFSDPRLIQLFGRYATYVGGSPLSSPALLSLIWHAEVSGVWRVEGGMHKLALAIAERFQAIGGTLALSSDVREIVAAGNRAEAILLRSGGRIDADTVVFAGDPRALATGKLGPSVVQVASQTLQQPRSLSARVWSFAARPETSLKLGYHNVFFGSAHTAEFEDIAGGAMPNDPTIYVCAEDRGAGYTPARDAERFEIILNAAALTTAAAQPDEEVTCRQTTFRTLEQFGVTFDPLPSTAALATPATYEKMFPASAGALYGQTPHGMTAALKRPRARTAIRGLYLAGGGTHPGAGVPMAALSGKHAAEAILKDLVST